MDNYTFQLVDKKFIFSETVLKTPFCEGTVFYRTFFDTEFIPQKEISLAFSKDTFKLIIPLIREGILYIPNGKSFPELHSLLNYLAGDNDYWIKLSLLIANPKVLSPIGKLINLSESVFEGHYFTKDTAMLYEPYSKELDIKMQNSILEEAKLKGIFVSFCRTYDYTTTSPDSYHSALNEIVRSPIESTTIEGNLIPNISYCYDAKYDDEWCRRLYYNSSGGTLLNRQNYHNMRNGERYYYECMASYSDLQYTRLKFVIDSHASIDRTRSELVKQLVDYMARNLSRINRVYYVLWV